MQKFKLGFSLILLSLLPQASAYAENTRPVTLCLHGISLDGPSANQVWAIVFPPAEVPDLLSVPDFNERPESADHYSSEMGYTLDMDRKLNILTFRAKKGGTITASTHFDSAVSEANRQHSQFISQVWGEDFTCFEGTLK